MGDEAIQTESAGQDAAEQNDARHSAGETSPDPVSELIAAVTALTAEVHRNQERAAARERVIDKLHAEVEQLRTGERNLLLRPVTTDLQNLRRDLLHQARSLTVELTQQQAADLLESFALSAELALERCGSIPIRPERNTEFSAREHRVVRTVPAEEPQQHERIAAVISDGYLDTATDRVTVSARVHVYRWNSTVTPSTEEAANRTDEGHPSVSADAKNEEGTCTDV